MIRALLLLLLLPIAAWAQDMPQPQSDTVSDFAGVLSAPQAADLTATLKQARSETGAQIVVVVMDARADYGGSGQSIEIYAKNLFNAWGIGDKKRNDGILILVARRDREMRIALGAGYDAVYDGLAQRVIDREMLPEFRNGRYPEGIQAGVKAVIDRLARPFASHNPPPPQQRDTAGLLTLLSYVLFAGLFGSFALRRQIGDFATRFQACPKCGRKMLSRSRSVQIAATAEIAGSGIQTTRCGHCDYSHNESYSISRTPRSSGSGGGFGGGRSSGGGASGRW